MEIQIINPKKLYLQGNISVLEEKTERNDNERELDFFSESVIVYPDLVFALKHNPTKYFRSYIRFEKDKLKVISNILFFRAAREAGLKEIKFDLLLDHQIPLEQLIEKYNLKIDSSIAQRKNYLDRFLFFSNPVSGILESNSSQIKLHSDNKNSEYQRNNCVRYSLLLYDDPEKAATIEHAFVAKLFNENGYLRSIDGLRSRTGLFGDYIKGW